MAFFSVFYKFLSVLLSYISLVTCFQSSLTRNSNGITLFTSKINSRSGSRSESISLSILSQSIQSNRHLSLKMTIEPSILTNIASKFLSDPINSLIPLCIEPTSKTTTINDPTAGMTPDEIANYMSNVGGGLCGYPEYVRDILGLGLNLNLIVFGILTVGYAVLGGYKFFLERSLDEIAKPYNSLLTEPTSKRIFESNTELEKEELEKIKDGKDGTKSFEPREGPNRSEKRLQKRLGESKKSDN